MSHHFQLFENEKRFSTLSNNPNRNLNHEILLGESKIGLMGRRGLIVAAFLSHSSMRLLMLS